MYSIFQLFQEPPASNSPGILCSEWSPGPLPKTLFPQGSKRKQDCLVCLILKCRKGCQLRTCAKSLQSCPTLHPMDHSPPGSSVLGILQARILTGLGCHFLLQGIFPAQGSNPSFLSLLRWQAGSYHSHHLANYVIFCLVCQVISFSCFEFQLTTQG